MGVAVATLRWTNATRFPALRERSARPYGRPRSLQIALDRQALFRERPLGREPTRIGPYINHRNRSTTLKECDQLKQERCSGFSKRTDGVAPAAVAAEHPVGCYTAYIEPG